MFTDTPPPASVQEDSSFSLSRQDETLNLTIERTDRGETTQFTAVNPCLCVATFTLKILHSDDPAVPNGSDYYEVLQPQSRKLLVSLEKAGRGNPNLKYNWMIVPGSPDAQHQPSRPYRAPFAVGSTFLISQAFPTSATHNTPDSRYAVDIALPDGTPVYAAREGLVINVRHDNFRGGLSPIMMDQANAVTILHDDGTIALYGHLHWDSIRVHIGQHVERGQYIANSGNTGFSSGPHLHFAVLRNDGSTGVSVPVEFEGPSGVAVRPETHKELTAY